MNLELFLADADDQRPVLEPGLPSDSLRHAPSPERMGRAPTHLWDPTGDPNSLPTQRWGIIAPEGPAGDRLLALIEPLRKLRQEQQGGEPVPILRAPAGQDGPSAVQWKDTLIRDESLPEQEWPRYLLLLGDLDKLSLELQQVLGSDAFVGRLAFRGEQGYEAYVEKVLRWERTPAAGSRARSLFFTVHDDTLATQVGYHSLVQPSLQACRERQQRGGFPASDILEVGTPEDWSLAQLLEQVAQPQPGVLFSVSHGLGAPRKGWRSAAAQLEQQGAMCLGPGERLLGEDVATRPFLPGGLWIYIACFGAGTPASSAYFHWLRRLQQAGQFPGRPDWVLASLPKAGERPFTAALPQAALANPEGPLAVIGHVDLAWNYSFQDFDPWVRSRPSRFLGVLRALIEGRRAGVGLGALLHAATEVNQALLVREDRDAADLEAGRPMAQDEGWRGRLWMTRQDVSAYVLLGDPAVRLPLASQESRRATVTGPAQASALLGLPVAAAVPQGPGVENMEEAVIALLGGAEALKDIAARAGVSLAELRRWERLYREAGRAALASSSKPPRSGL